MHRNTRTDREPTGMLSYKESNSSTSIDQALPSPFGVRVNGVIGSECGACFCEVGVWFTTPHLVLTVDKERRMA